MNTPKTPKLEIRVESGDPQTRQRDSWFITLTANGKTLFYSNAFVDKAGAESTAAEYREALGLLKTYKINCRIDGNMVTEQIQAESLTAAYATFRSMLGERLDSAETLLVEGQ